MEYRAIGKTGIQVSEIGYGTWGIGGRLWKGSSNEQSISSLHMAIDKGVNFIDSAHVYGHGRAELLIGQVLKERDEVVHVTSKIQPRNYLWPMPDGTPLEEAYPRYWVFRMTQESLERMEIETLDVQYFHVWTDTWAEDEGWQRTVQDLKDKGMIRAFGISVNDFQPENVIKAMETGLVDVVQVIYNIFEQAPEDELFPAAQEMGVGIVARVPFDEGGLTGVIKPDTTFEKGDMRNVWFAGDRLAQTVERAEALKALVAEYGYTLPEAAIRFCLSHPAVASVIPGMRKPQHVEANTALGDGKGLPPELLERLRAHRWDRA
jgi:aryl-alcohol dehydrogenase-like predicted oxidoreductase